MDKTVLIAILVAVIAIFAVTMVLNPFETESDTQTPEETTDGGSTETAVDKTEPASDNENHNGGFGITQQDINEITDTKVTGNCTLYYNLLEEKYQCFGVAGNYSTISGNEHREATSEKYFCKPTIYGCKLYQKVDFQLS
jgi:hypothetical protein